MFSQITIAVAGLGLALFEAAAADSPTRPRFGAVDFQPSPEQPVGFCADGNRLFTHLGLVVDATTGKVLAQYPHAGHDPGPILADGLVLDLAVVDKRSGTDLPDGGCELRFCNAQRLLPVGRGRLAVDPAVGAKLQQRVACVRRATMHWGGDGFGSNQSASSPVADGPDIFLRSHDNLYCLTVAQATAPKTTWDQFRVDLSAAYAPGVASPNLYPTLQRHLPVARLLAVTARAVELTIETISKSQP